MKNNITNDQIIQSARRQRQAVDSQMSVAPWQPRHRQSRTIAAIIAVAASLVSFIAGYGIRGKVSLPEAQPLAQSIVVQHDTTTVHHRDTTFRRDSVYIREWIKGDTVYIEKYKDRYVFRDRWRDSISVREVHDTTAVEVKVEKNLSWSQKAKIGAFPWLLLAFIGALVWIFRKYLF